MRAAIYCRISRDRNGTSLGVQRQEELCRELAMRQGMEVACIFTDNNVSAFSGAPRPAYANMVKVIQEGEVDAVIAWQLDRFYRRPRELEDFIVLVEQTGIKTHTVMAGAFDLNSSMGRAMARTAVSFAALEVENGRDRVLAAKLQAAKAGRTSGGNRAYGWNQDGLTLNEAEATIVREIVRRFISGESWRSIALDLNARDIPTAKGKMWTAINVRNVATLRRHYGIRVHNGREYKASWTPLLSRDTWDELQVAIKRGQALYGKRSTTRKHLLMGFVFCGICGCRMHIVSAQQRRGGYVPAFCCRKKDHRGQIVGCGKIKRLRDPIEALVVDSIMYRLDTPDLGAVLADQSDPASSAEIKQLMHEHETQSQRLQEILTLYSTGDMTLDEYRLAKTTAAARLDALGRELERKTSRATLANLPAGQTLREAWDKADMQWRRQLLDTVIDKVLVHPRQPGDGKVKYKGFVFNPDRIEIRWKH